MRWRSFVPSGSVGLVDHRLEVRPVLVHAGFRVVPLDRGGGLDPRDVRREGQATHADLSEAQIEIGLGLARRCFGLRFEVLDLLVEVDEVALDLVPVVFTTLAEVALGGGDLLVGLHLRAGRLGDGFLVCLGDLLVGLGLSSVGLLLFIGALVAAGAERERERERERRSSGRKNRCSSH